VPPGARGRLSIRTRRRHQLPAAQRGHLALEQVDATLLRERPRRAAPHPAPSAPRGPLAAGHCGSRTRARRSRTAACAISRHAMISGATSVGGDSQLAHARPRADCRCSFMCRHRAGRPSSRSAAIQDDGDARGGRAKLASASHVSNVTLMAKAEGFRR